MLTLGMDGMELLFLQRSPQDDPGCLKTVFNCTVVMKSVPHFTRVAFRSPIRRCAAAVCRTEVAHAVGEGGAQGHALMLFSLRQHCALETVSTSTRSPTRAADVHQVLQHQLWEHACICLACETCGVLTPACPGLEAAAQLVTPPATGSRSNTTPMCPPQTDDLGRRGARAGPQDDGTRTLAAAPSSGGPPVHVEAHVLRRHQSEFPHPQLAPRPRKAFCQAPIHLRVSASCSETPSASPRHRRRRCPCV